MKREVRYVDLRGKPEEKHWYYNKKRAVQVILFFLLLFSGTILSLILPLRPSVSAIEKRELAKFPTFSFETLTDGSYFKQIDTWFSDTFPFRETLISANTNLTSWYGFGSKITGLENKGDDIPDVPMTEDEYTTEKKQEETTESKSEKSTEEKTEKSTEKTTEETTRNITGKAKKTETLGGILVVGNSGYEYYNFVQSYADRYIKVVNNMAKKLKGTAEVYDILVPTSIDITLDDATRASLSTSDQKKAIEYFYGSMSKNVKTVNIFDTLLSHRTEYIYFRTDHHWTALGAYYAYTCFAEAKGVKAVDLKKFSKVSFGDFYGSFYTDTGKNGKLKKGKDELIAYKPYYETKLTYWENSGNHYEWPLINDVSNYNISYKYSAFAGGDNPYTTIVNKDVKKGTAIVIKESFGNAMIPYIVGNYHKVYVVDYRYWSGKISSLVKSKKADDVIFINNMSATRNEALIEDLETVCK